jgi:hypothetical protein
VVVGDQGAVLTSTNLAVWTAQTSTTVNLLNAVTYGNDEFVAVGYGGTVVTSPDGVTWSSRSSRTNSWLFDVTYAAGQYVVVGESGAILTSPDARSWVVRGSETSQSLWGVSYAGGCFVAVGEGGTILTSEDGVVWTPRPSGTTKWLLSVAARESVTATQEGVVVAVGTRSAVTRSLVPPPTTLRLTEPRMRSDGAFEFKITGTVAGQALTAYRTETLTNWLVLTNLTAGVGLPVVTDSSAVNATHRSYRVSSP